MYNICYCTFSLLVLIDWESFLFILWPWRNRWMMTYFVYYYFSAFIYKQFFWFKKKCEIRYEEYWLSRKVIFMSKMNFLNSLKVIRQTYLPYEQLLSLFIIWLNVWCSWQVSNLKFLKNNTVFAFKSNSKGNINF